MKKTILFGLLFSCISSFGQVNLVQLKSSDIPSNMKHEGKMVNAIRWEDNFGLNYVITTETGRIYRENKTEQEVFDAYLYAYHYVIKGDSTKLNWRVYDYNKGCDLDLDFYFISKAFAITDLDKDGIAEVWLMYKNCCHGDVGPIPTKIIMYEGLKKYAVRGESKVKISEKDYAGGNYTLDANFKGGPFVFMEYAKKLWEQNVLAE